MYINNQSNLNGRALGPPSAPARPARGTALPVPGSVTCCSG